MRVTGALMASAVAGVFALLAACGGGGSSGGGGFLLPGAKITGVVSQVVDGKSQGIAASVTVKSSDGKSTTTNASGVYTLENVTSASAVVVSVEPAAPTAAGANLLMSTSRTVTLAPGGTSTVDFTLAGASPTILVASAGGTVQSVGSVSGLKAKVQISANDLVLQAGGAPTGTVDVYVLPIDVSVTRSQFGNTAGMEAFPGGMVGVATGGQTVDFVSYGAVGIDIYDRTTNGAVNLKTGATATVTIPVPWDFQKTATASAALPATMPLWYFNKASGKWVEEGTATKTGTAPGNYVYVGTVKHFSFWNADDPVQVTDVTGVVQFADGSRAHGAAVTFRGVGYGFSAVVFTDAAGQFKVRGRRSFAAKVIASAYANGGRMTVEKSLTAGNLASATHDVGTLAFAGNLPVPGGPSELTLTLDNSDPHASQVGIMLAAGVHSAAMTFLDQADVVLSDAGGPGAPATLTITTSKSTPSSGDYGVQEVSGTFDSVTSVPTSGYKHASSKTFDTQPGTGQVFAVRTVDSAGAFAYAKLEVVSATKPTGTGTVWTIRIRYVYKGDGSNTF
ncbi:carboxypeptidase-like regulatory domain-containing protein [Planctomycetota bacterium]